MLKPPKEILQTESIDNPSTPPRRRGLRTYEAVPPLSRIIARRRRHRVKSIVVVAAASSLLPPPLNPLIAMLVQPQKILPHPPLPILHHIPLLKILKPPLQPPNRRSMELILMRLQIPQLRKMLPTLIQLASIRFSSGVHDFVSPHISVLGESFAADVAVVGALAGVAPLVGFEVAELAEALVAVEFLAEERFDAGVDAGVDVEVGFLAKGFVAAGDGAFVLLF